MSDASRAIIGHFLGATPSRSGSLPVSISGLDEAVVSAAEDAGYLIIPAPPESGTVFLKSTAGVLSWGPAA